MKLISSYIIICLAEVSQGFAKEYSNPAIVSWGPPRLDLFGVTPKGDIWHKYSTTYGWEPHSGPGKVEIFDHASAKSSVSTASWGPNRVNFVFIDDDGITRHKYWYGSGWGPDKGFENLGKGPVGSVKITSWGENRLDLVGLGKDGTLLHKAWTGLAWYPGVEEWEDLGGKFAEDPSAISWGEGRLDIFGVNEDGSLIHKFWNGRWQPENDEWENLGGKKLKTIPTLSTPSAGRVDIWAVGELNELYHLFWNGVEWQGWESLGGNFSTTPQVVHYSLDNIDIVGRDNANAEHFVYKHWDGGSWSTWHSKGGSFASEPAAIRLGTDNLQIVGVDKDGKIQFQIWNGFSWFPGPASWYEIGDIEATSAAAPLEIQESWIEKVIGNKDLKFELRFRA